MKTFKLTLDQQQYTQLRVIFGCLKTMGVEQSLITALDTQFEEVDPDMNYDTRLNELGAKIDGIAEALQEHTEEYDHDKFVDDDHEHPSEEELIEEKITEAMEEVERMIAKAVQAHAEEIEQRVVATIEQMNFHQLVVDSIKKLVNA